MLATLLDRDNFLGRILTGLVFSGSVKTNQQIHALDNDGKIVETGRASKIMTFRGLERVPTDEAQAVELTRRQPRHAPGRGPLFLRLIFWFSHGIRHPSFFLSLCDCAPVKAPSQR